MDVHTVACDGITFATIFRSSYRPAGTSFLSPAEYTLQLGVISHPKGTKIRDHRHNPDLVYTVNTTQEVLYLESGRVKASIYTADWELVEEIVLLPGDILLSTAGGHGFEFLEDSSLIEVKQGPFPGDKLMKYYRDEAKK